MEQLVEAYEKVELDSVEDVEVRIKKQFKEKVWLYVVLDFAVGFGIYENGSFMIRLDHYEKPVPLDWEYLQELRIFNETGELRLTPFEGRWIGRYRGSNIFNEKKVLQSNEYCIDEQQKIWGRVKDTSGLWSLLASERGTRIWVPEKEEAREWAVCLRKFMRMPNIEDKELVYQTDIRMVGFCPWGQEHGKAGDELGE
ncbi:MAG: CRISPR-associated protein Csx19 [Faecalicatena sp.]|uniref:type III-D CRISPR-associated protein Csx19 n=1 Tax=Faecalicatena sp. TaxID=2005360 RepID=UPI00258A4E83|nr:CRISPR-associated protein Csx19 [Faecalicatena sp.]MCI6465070.1 CRISPR-associated protein Csx19 [Faecalicatena sp.]MDY5617099.1 CRISPR-associated protein Csx19 [Lachnospiraceae bacterium]